MNSEKQLSEKDKFALKTYLKFIRGADSLSSRINSNLANHNLSESQFSVLEALYSLGSLTQKDLGNKLLKSGVNITMVIDNLEKRELVKRKRGKPDRRYFRIILTKKGTKKIAELFPIQAKIILNELAILKEKEHRSLQKISKKLGLGISK